MLLSRAVARHGASLREETPLINTTTSLIALSAVDDAGVPGRAGPCSSSGTTRRSPRCRSGSPWSSIGFLVLATRRHAFSQLIGFLVLDNGIATVAFLTAAGIPLVVELGASLDLLLVVLILQVLTARIRTEFGDADLDDLTELRD